MKLCNTDRPESKIIRKIDTFREKNQKDLENIRKIELDKMEKLNGIHHRRK